MTAWRSRKWACDLRPCYRVRAQAATAPTAHAPDQAGAATTMDPAEIIQRLGLTPHPEGGHYREMFRDTVPPGTRAASTAIYFLLRAGEVSRWHKVDAAEVWHFYAGEPLELTIQPAGAPRQLLSLGIDLAHGQRPQAVVPAHAWQMARPMGAWTLVGCTVAPAFEFRGFTLAPDGFEPPV
jgi:uncharacterized protein